MRHRVFRDQVISLGRLQTLMRRRKLDTGVIDYPVDKSERVSLYTTFSRVSDLQDEVGRPGSSKFVSRPCDHVKVSMTMPENMVIAASESSGGYYYDLTYTGNLPGIATLLFGIPTSSMLDLATFVDSLLVQDAVPSEPFIDWEALENDFLELSNNILSKEVLLGETLAQPQLFVDAVKFLISPARGMQRLVKYVVKHYSPRELRSAYTLGRVVRRVLQDSANSTLMYNFAVKPALSDLRGIEKSTRVIGNQLEYLRRNKGQYVPVRVRQVAASSGFPLPKADGSPPDPLPSSSYHPPYASLFRSPAERLRVATMGANFRVRQDLTLEANFNAFAQYFGVGQVVGLLWELVPFSFVIDWVSNAGERIQKLSQVHTYNPFCDSKGFCATLKDVSHLPVRVSSGYLPVYGATIPEEESGLEIASIQTSRFTRYLTIPTDRSLFDLSNVGLSQLINGSSLLIQKLFKRR